MPRLRWHWGREGFAAPPKLEISRGGELLYRAWGGRSVPLGNTNRAGVCFTRDRARTRAEAELLYSIAEWGNSFWLLTIYEVPAAIPMWVGRVDPGDCHPTLRAAGTQVFIESRHARSLRAIDTVRLVDDLGGRWIHTRAHPPSRLSH